MCGFQSIFKKMLSKKKGAKILMTGLDAAGKTTILYNIKLGEIFNTMPEIGFNGDTFEYNEYKNISFTVWDIGKSKAINRPYLKNYYDGCSGLIFVVDSSNFDRIDEARDELNELLKEDLLKNVPLLVFANKQDLPEAMTVKQITEKLNLNSLSGSRRAWMIQGSCAISGEGLYEGLDWLSRTI